MDLPDFFARALKVGIRRSGHRTRLYVVVQSYNSG